MWNGVHYCSSFNRIFVYRYFFSYRSIQMDWFEVIFCDRCIGKWNVIVIECSNTLQCLYPFRFRFCQVILTQLKQLLDYWNLLHDTELLNRHNSFHMESWLFFPHSQLDPFQIIFTVNSPTKPQLKCKIKPAKVSLYPFIFS